MEDSLLETRFFRHSSLFASYSVLGTVLVAEDTVKSKILSLSLWSL